MLKRSFLVTGVVIATMSVVLSGCGKKPASADQAAEVSGQETAGETSGQEASVAGENATEEQAAESEVSGSSAGDVAEAVEAAEAAEASSEASVTEAAQESDTKDETGSSAGLVNSGAEAVSEEEIAELALAAMAENLKEAEALTGQNPYRLDLDQMNKVIEDVSKASGVEIAQVASAADVAEVPNALMESEEAVVAAHFQNLEDQRTLAEKTITDALKNGATKEEAQAQAEEAIEPLHTKGMDALKQGLSENQRLGRKMQNLGQPGEMLDGVLREKAYGAMSADQQALAYELVDRCEEEMSDVLDKYSPKMNLSEIASVMNQANSAVSTTVFFMGNKAGDLTEAQKQQLVDTLVMAAKSAMTAAGYGE